MHYQESAHTDLDCYLAGLKATLENQDVIELQFEDFAQFDLLSGGFEVDKEFIFELALKMENNNLYSEPRIKRGIIKRAIDSPIVIYSGNGSINYRSSSYRNGLLMLRVAILMAKIDGDAAAQEIGVIRNLIWDMAILSTIEKRCLYAKAIYLFSSNQKYDERARDYVRVALDRDSLLERIQELNPVTAGRLLTIAKDVAVADGFIHRSELTFLQDMYRVLGLSARSARSDLETYAKEKFIDLKSRGIVEYPTEDELDEVDDLLGDLILDF